MLPYCDLSDEMTVDVPHSTSDVAFAAAGKILVDFPKMLECRS